MSSIAGDLALSPGCIEATTLALPGRGGDDADDREADAGVRQHACRRPRAADRGRGAKLVGARRANSFTRDGPFGERAGHDPDAERDAERRKPRAAPDRVRMPR